MSATCYTGCTPPTIGITPSPPAARAPTVAPPAAHPLAFTGASIELMVVVALAVIAVGIGLYWLARARRSV